MTLEQYNLALPQTLRQPDNVIHAIKARQLNPGEDVDRSPFMSDALLAACRLEIDKIRQSCETLDGLDEMTNKARGKFWGPQGKAPNRSIVMQSLESYYGYNPPITMGEMPTEIRIALRIKAAGIRARRDLCLGELPCYDDAVKLLPNHRSNSGFRGFTSDKEAKLRLIESAIIGAQAIETGTPMALAPPVIQWYRDQRQKWRSIFGDALDALLYARKLSGHWFCERLYHNKDVAYYSPLYVAKRVAEYSRKHKVITCVEGDFEAMDQHITLNLAKWATNHWASACDLTKRQRRPIAKVLEYYFNAPVVDLNCTVHLGQHQLFSGQYPTNGCEDDITSLVCLYFLFEVAKEYHCDYLSLVMDSELFVMGDDSAILIPLEIEPTWASNKFAEISGNLFGLPAEPSKQRVSRKSMWFCKRGYDLHPDGKPGARDSGLLVPIYPLDLSLLNITYPESGPAFSADHQSYAPEIPCILSRFDNAYGDPAWEKVVTMWAKEYNPKALLDDLRLASDIGWHQEDWREKVYGAKPWSILTSPTARLLSRLAR